MLMTASRSSNATRTMKRIEWRNGCCPAGMSGDAGATVATCFSSPPFIAPDYNMKTLPVRRVALASTGKRSYDSRAKLGGRYEARSKMGAGDNRVAGILCFRACPDRQDRDPGWNA